MRYRIKSNELREKVLQRGEPIYKAARRMSMNPEILKKCLEEDRQVTVRTAWKFQQMYGSSVVEVL